MNYFILINDVQQGPFTVEELRQRGIQQDTLVWCEGMPQWTPAWQVDELKPLLFGTSVPPQQPPHTSQPVPPPPPLRDEGQQSQDYAQPTGQTYSQPYNNPQPQYEQTSEGSGNGNAPTEPDKKKSHKGCWMTAIIVIVILFIMALFNPSEAEHRKAILDKIDTTSERVDSIDDPMVRGVVSGIMQMGNGVVKEAVRQLIDDNLEYHNYIIFSTTTLKSDMLRKEIRTSTGFLGHVNAVSLSNILPDIIMQQMGGGDSFDNGTTETTTTTVDGDGNETTETTKTTKKNGVTVDSLTKRVTNQIADEVAKKVKSEARQQADSATVSGIDAIVDDVLNFIKGL